MKPTWDLGFADDLTLVLLFNSHQQMQENTDLLATILLNVGLSKHRTKTKILKNSPNSNNCRYLITLNGSPLEKVMSFTYLSNFIDHHGGTDANVKARMEQASVAFLQLKNICIYRELSLPIILFNSSMKAILLVWS